jgi:signal transduction histidine kinase
MAPELDQLPDAVIQVDGSRRIVGANAAATELIGFDVADLLGRDCAAALEARDREGRPVWVRGWHRSARLPSVRTLPEQEIILRGADGIDVRAFVTGSYQRDPTGEITGAVLVLRDARRRMHHTVTGIEIVSTVSHELRSPLTSVKGYTSLLMNRWDRLGDEQKRMMLEQVNHDADRVTRLITELLDISRLETGRLVLRRQMIDLSTLTDSVLDQMTMEYPGLEVTRHFDQPFPSVYADPDKVLQVITNLVENACKYGSPRGLEVRGDATDEEVALSVTDRGPGIPPEDLDRVFTKFFRRPEGKPTGSGLGLWISRGLVEAHGGRLSVRSITGQGSTFRFTLPRVEPEILRQAMANV